jgi:hypothetical protein
VCHTDVTLDRRETGAEGASGFALNHAPADGLDDPLSQIFGVGFYTSVVPDGPVTLQAALGYLLASRLLA